jgi:hypothetical protein
MRAVPFMPYLSFAPSAWVFPLKFDGGGYCAGGKAMFDSEGNLWVGDNFTVGFQGRMRSGRATRLSLHQMENLFPRLPRALPAGECKEAPLARQ